MGMLLYLVILSAGIVAAAGLMFTLRAVKLI
jgi:hypothetical protein